MTDKPDVKAAVYFDELQKKVIVEIGTFDNDDDANDDDDAPTTFLFARPF